MFRFVRRLVCLVALGFSAAGVAASSTVVAQSTLRVPEDYASIQDAIDAANPGDTILVGQGTWCGAAVTKRLVLRGEGGAAVTGIGCSGPLDPQFHRITGFLLQKTAAADPSGTTIEHFTVFDVFTGINAVAADGVVVQHNTLQPQRAGIFSVSGSNWTVAFNQIDNRRAINPFANAGINNNGGSGWTVVHNDLVGTFVGVLLRRAPGVPPRPSNNTVSFNHIEGGFDGAGIDLVAQDGVVVTGNDISLPTSAENQGSLCAGAWGISVSDASGPQGPLTSIDSTITNNNTRDTQVGVLVLLDAGGAAGNAAGLVLRGNQGTLALNQACDSGGITGVIKSRSISTLIVCDADGNCQ